MTPAIPPTQPQPKPVKPVQVLKGIRILSLAPNLPGPAALMRCRQMGATCIKLEAPVPAGAAPQASSDPLSLYSRLAYDVLHQGIKTIAADLKTDAGQKALHRELAKADVLITSFRPMALKKLGLEWLQLSKRYPKLSMVAIFGALGTRADEPGHDLTYVAENGLVSGLDLPPSLFADMGGSLVATEAVLQACLHQLQKGKGTRLEVGLCESAAYLALPQAWGLTTANTPIGGGHAGYAVYPCKDGRVALAALEPHFAAALGAAIGLADASIPAMFLPATRQAIARYMADKTRAELDALAVAKDIPLFTMA